LPQNGGGVWNPLACTCSCPGTTCGAVGLALDPSSCSCTSANTSTSVNANLKHLKGDQDPTVFSWQLILVLVFSATTVVFLLTTTYLAVQLRRMRCQRRRQQQQQGSHTDCSSSGCSCAYAEKLRGPDLCISEEQVGARLLPNPAPSRLGPQIGAEPPPSLLGPRDWAWYPDQLSPIYRAAALVSTTASSGATADSCSTTDAGLHGQQMD
jgi:hypothetical protein